MENVQTSGNQGQESQSVPQITSFQFNKESIGKIKESVNLFRGTVSLPLNLVSLPGLQDLDVNFMTLYGSNVKKNLENWNISHPTSVVGLGWSLLTEKIVVQKNNSGNQASDEYYLLSAGSGEQLIQTGTTIDGDLIFQTRNYKFWKITYNPYKELWTITKENGVVHTYGNNTLANNAVEYGVRWGNWLGNSSLTVGQEQYATAWNLTEKKNLWKNTVHYEYLQETQFVGSEVTGKKYTQACYISQITDSLGRKLQFSYGKKYGAQNPSSDGIIEYQAANTKAPEPNAYQDTYETKYLESVAIINELGNQLFSIHFGYDFINTSSNSGTTYNLLYKRILTKIWQVSAEGRELPGYEFSYFDKFDDVSPGSLKQITFPYGGIASYSYKQQSLTSSRNLKVNAPISGATPRIWYGSDYTVITWYHQESQQMKAQVYSWSGTWEASQLSSSTDLVQPFTNVNFELETLSVITQKDSIILTFTNKNTNAQELYFYNRNQEKFGAFELKKGPERLFLKSGATQTTKIAAGDNYIIVNNKEFSSQPFYGYQWNWKSRLWESINTLPSFSDGTSADFTAINANKNYYIACFYNNTVKSAKFQIFYHNALNTWQNSATWNTSLTIYTDPNNPDQFPFSFNLSESLGTCTYITNINDTEITYAVRILQWNTNFYILNPESQVVNTYTCPIENREALFNVLQTYTNSSLTANNPYLNRYVGGSGSSNNPLNWIPKQFSFVKTNSYNYAFGNDIAVQSEKTANTVNNTYYQFNPNSPDSGGWGAPGSLASQGEHPTLSDNYMTLGSDVFYRQPNGDWIKLSQSLINLTAPETVQNRASNYIVYQDTTNTNAQTYIAFTQNGQISTPEKINAPSGAAGQKVYIDQKATLPGTLLAGYSSFVTYPSDESFDTTSYLNLYRVENNNAVNAITVSVVANVHIENLLESTSFWQSYDYLGVIDATITYDAVNDLPQFPQVQVIPSTKSPDEVTRSEGSIVNYYSNGVSTQSSLAYPANWIYNYNLLLNGTLLGKVIYDATGKEVASELNFYSIIERDPNGFDFLYSGYSNLTQTIKKQDGVTKITSNTFANDIGQLQSTSFNYYDANGKEQKLLVEKKYAIQVPTYTNSMQKIHLFTNVVQEIISVTDIATNQKTITSSGVSTWKNWGDNTNELWAVFEKYQWEGSDNGTPDFDFDHPSSSANWLHLSSVISRTSQTGNITEQSAINGMRTSYLYDQQGIHQIAEFPNASTQLSETSYYSFTDIEDSNNWILHSGAAIIPNETNTTIDANTGTKSLWVNPATSNAISLQITPQSPDNDLYLFSCFYKKPIGFSANNGNAQWKISCTQNGSSVGTDIIANFPDVTGTWSYLYAAIDLSEYQPSQNGFVTLTISLNNNNTVTNVLVDNLRFSPLSSAIGAVNLAVDSAEVNATIGANGEVKRFLFDDFQQEIAATNSANEISELKSYYYSRSGNNGIFDTAAPNSSLIVNATEGGTLCDFTRGEECWDTWLPNNTNNWTLQNQQLVYTGNTEGTLTLKNNAYTNYYAIATKVTTHELPTQPLGINIGTSYTIQYNVSLGEWQLITNSNSEIIKRKKFNRLFTATTADANPYGASWLLLVSKNTILFFANGKQVLSYVSPTEISGIPQLFLSNPAAISYLINSKKNNVSQTFSNGAASDQQSQLLLNNKVSIIQNIYDALGRPAIHTKPAYLTPDDTTDLLSYTSGFAEFNWATNSMSGTILSIYPEDEGFPYFQQVYEASQLGRVIETSMPGKIYSIGMHSAKNSYGCNDGSLGLPKAQYYKATEIDQNGNATWAITDQRGHGIYKISQKGTTDTDVIKTFNEFDAFGKPIKQYPPNYYNPPTGTVANDWVVLNTYDFLGRNIETSNTDSGTVHKIFDYSGRVRFRQDAQGALDGNYQYFKYDIQNRLVEMGYITGTWNETQLTTYATANPEWPATPDTWRKKFKYDGQGTEKNQIGRLIQVEVNNANNGTATSNEQYEYDVNGNIITKVFGAAKIGSENYTMKFVYNSIGSIVLIKYPTTNGQAPMSISYEYNDIGQITGVGTDLTHTNNVASYTYNASGKPETETVYTESNADVQRVFNYNSPIWLTKITASNTGNSAILFEEELSYTAKTDQEVTYYNGQPSSLGFSYKTNQTPYTNAQSCFYNGIGALTANKNSVLNKETQYSYDQNNNFKLVTKENTTYLFDYNTNNTVNAVKNEDGTVTYKSFEYDSNGNIKKALSTPEGNQLTHGLQFNYDPGILLTNSIADLVNSGISYEFEYDGMNQRIIKETVIQGETDTMKVYIRGINTSSLLTFSSTGNNTVLNPEYFIYGPLGMIAQTDLSHKKIIVRDHLNSTRMVVDEQLNLLASYAYDTFGTLSVIYESTPQVFDYLYTGQEWDATIELYNFKSRFYFSDIGRFGAVDAGQQFYSPYIYAGNNPIIFIDPSGNFSIGNFFSAIAGAIIGAVEILIGVAIDVVAGVLEVVTGGLATPVSVGLAALSGFFYGAGTSALVYSTVGLITNDFSWKDYGISMGIGAATGAIGSAFGAAGAAVQASAKATITAAAETGQAVSTLTKVANAAAKPAFQIAGAAVAGTTGTFLNNAAYGNRLDSGLGEAFITGIISGTLGWAIPTPEYKAGWGEFAKRAAANIGISEGVGVSMQLTSNAIHGNSIDTGLLNTVVSGVVGGSTSAIGASDYGKAKGQQFNDEFAAMFNDIEITL